MTFDPEILVHGLLLLFGAFYSFAGVAGLKAALSSRFIDIAVASIEGKPPLQSETARAAWMLVGALLVLAGGLALLLRLEWAAWIFLASAAAQALYLLAVAPLFLDPTDPPDPRGRQQTVNAFIIYAAVTAFLLWAYGTGRLIPLAEVWLPALAVAGLLLAAAAIYGAKSFIFPFANPGFAADASAAGPAPGMGDGEPDTADRPIHTSRRILLMADYHCDPLWAHDADLDGTIPTADLGLSPELAADLTAWSDAYTNALNPDDPLNPDWTPDDFRAHWKEGVELARRLKRELPDREIFVYDSDSGHIEVHLDSSAP